MARVEPGLAAGGGLVAAALVLDVALIRRKCEPISTVVRRSHVARAVVAYLACHLFWTWRWDPLSMLGHWYESTRVQHPPT